MAAGKNENKEKKKVNGGGNLAGVAKEEIFIFVFIFIFFSKLVTGSTAQKWSFVGTRGNI